jgi:hypothetical protein
LQHFGPEEDLPIPNKISNEEAKDKVLPQPANRKERKEKRFFWAIAVFFIFVIPVVAVNLQPVPLWLGRATAVSSFTFFLTVAIFWFGLDPKTRMIMGGRLAQPELDRERKKIEIGIRIAVVVFGVFFFWLDAFPLASDLIHLLKGEARTTFTAKVAYRTTALGGVLLGENSVRLVPGGDSYYAFYNWTKPLRVGESYEFVVLPRSRMILDFRGVKLL